MKAEGQKELENLLSEVKKREDKKILFGTAVLQKIIGKQKLEEIIWKESWDYHNFRYEIEEYVEGDIIDFNWNENAFYRYVQNTLTSKEILIKLVRYTFKELLPETDRATEREMMEKIYHYSDVIREDMYESIARIPLSDRYDKSYALDTTPSYISNLCMKVMGIKNDKSKRFLDLCSGAGSTLLEAGLKNREIALYGQEINSGLCNESRARFFLANREAVIKCGNVITDAIGIYDNLPRKYDYIFSKPPFGVGNSDQHAMSIRTMKWRYRLKDMENAKRKSELTYAACLVDHLELGGKGCLLGSTGMLFRSGFEKQWRKQLIQDGKIESIIQLPAGIISGLGVATSIVVFSHNNDKIKMIDASRIFTKVRREKVLSDADVEKIYRMVTVESDETNCCICDYKDIMEKDYTLIPAVYFTKKIDNPVKLGEGGIEIVPGIDITGSKAETRYDDKSEYEALNLSDFDKFGEVGPLKRINGTAKEFEKYIIKKWDLILTAKGSVFKSMVADFDDSRKVVLMTKSLIIVRPNRDVWDPYYIKMFFDSADGQEIIDRSFIGTAMKSLSLKTLGDIELPHIPLDEQNKAAERYVKRQAEYRQAIATAKECEEKYFGYYDKEVKKNQSEG